MTHTQSLPWYAYVEHLLTPDHSYNALGWICWLANTAYPMAICMRLNEYYANMFLLPFALLYTWHECVQLVFVVVNWCEYVPTLHQQGIEENN